MTKMLQLTGLLTADYIWRESFKDLKEAQSLRGANADGSARAAGLWEDGMLGCRVLSSNIDAAYDSTWRVTQAPVSLSLEKS
jgi:hypothetical protein